MSLPPRLPTGMESRRTLESRLAEMEDRLAIRELASRFYFEVDNRDLEAVGELFTLGASFGTRDGVIRATGRDAILSALDKRFIVLGPANHVSHDHVIWFESESRARGMMSAHAELWRNDRAEITALRYDDVYEKTGGLWRFSERLLSYMYYLPVEDYVSALGRLDRNRASAAPAPADYPERLPTYLERCSIRAHTPNSE
jgi:hypothetical protein